MLGRRSCGALGARLLAARGPEQGEPLLEELLEFGDGASLEQHVPVGPDVLGGFDLGSLAALEQRVLAAPALHVGGTSASIEKGSWVRCPSGQTYVADGRFKGGYITRHYGRPAEGVEAVQMEIAMRGYLDEPEGAVSPTNWPVAFEAERAAATAAVLRRLIERCLDHAHRRATG